MIDKILESISLTKKDIHGMINDAVKEKSVKTSIQVPESLQKKLIENGKEADFNTFKENLPGGASTKAIEAFLKSNL